MATPRSILTAWRPALLVVAIAASTGSFASRAIAQDSMRLSEIFSPGHQYRVTTRTEISSKITVPAEATPDKKAKTLTSQGTSAIDYDERVLDGEGQGAVQKTFRIYDRFDQQLRIEDQHMQKALRKEARRMVVLRRGHAEVPFSPEGPLTADELTRVRIDVFVPALKGLLPDGMVRVGDTWKASGDAIEELTDLEEIREGQITCKLQEILMSKGRRMAQVSISGTVRGTGEEGPSRHQFQGHYLYDLEANYLAYLTFSATQTLLDKDDKPLGKVEGTFVLTRQLVQRPELRDDVIRLIDTEPTPENSLLLFDEPALGIRFVYGRRWRITDPDARQIRMSSPDGNSLVITLEPPRGVPTGQDFQNEALQTLRSAKVRLHRIDAPRRVGDGMETFQIEAEDKEGRVILDYYVTRQPTGGATFYARYPEKLAAEAHADVERIARSLRLVPPTR